MAGIARNAPPFVLGIDSLMPCPSLDVAKRLRARGFEFWGRYLENLSVSERDVLFEAGFAIWPISEARVEGFSADAGVADGARDCSRAMALGIPPSVHLCVDSEDTHGASAEDVAAYDNAVGAKIKSYGYDAELYVGAGQPLDARQLYALVFDRYTRAGSALIPEPAVGFSRYQLYPLDQTIEGVRVDVSVIQSDFRGRTPVLWYPQ